MDKIDLAVQRTRELQDALERGERISLQDFTIARRMLRDGQREAERERRQAVAARKAEAEFQPTVRGCGPLGGDGYCEDVVGKALARHANANLPANAHCYDGTIGCAEVPPNAHTYVGRIVHTWLG